MSNTFPPLPWGAAYNNILDASGRTIAIITHYDMDNRERDRLALEVAEVVNLSRNAETHTGKTVREMLLDMAVATGMFRRGARGTMASVTTPKLLEMVHARVMGDLCDGEQASPERGDSDDALYYTAQADGTLMPAAMYEPDESGDVP